MTRFSGILFAAAALVVGQTTPTQQVTGTVLDSITSVPVIDATVKISCWATRQALLVQEVLTDTQGGFLFKNVPAKFQTEYFCKLSATKNGYLPSAEQTIRRNLNRSS